MPPTEAQWEAYYRAQGGKLGPYAEEFGEDTSAYDDVPDPAQQEQQNHVDEEDEEISTLPSGAASVGDSSSASASAGGNEGAAAPSLGGGTHGLLGLLKGKGGGKDTFEEADDPYGPVERWMEEHCPDVFHALTQETTFKLDRLHGEYVKMIDDHWKEVCVDERVPFLKREGVGVIALRHLVWQHMLAAYNVEQFVELCKNFASAEETDDDYHARHAEDRDRKARGLPAKAKVKSRESGYSPHRSRTAAHDPWADDLEDSDDEHGSLGDIDDLHEDLGF